MKVKRKDKILNFVCPAVTVAVILLLWTAAAIAADSDYILPSVGKTVAKAFSLLGSGEFYAALGGTLARVLIAFISSFAIAFALAFSSYKSETAKKFVAPFIRILRALPTVAVVLLLLFWTNSRVAPVVVTMLVVLPTLYTDLCGAFSGVDKDAVKMCRAFRVPEKRVFFKVVLPQITPNALYAAGAGLSLNLKLMVAAEVLAQTARSLGYLLNSAKVYFEIAEMLALVTFTVILGVITESVFSVFAKKAGAR